MQRRRTLLGAGLAAVLTAGALGIGPAGAAPGAIVVKGRLSFSPNRFVHSTQHYEPGRRTVAPGGLVTLSNRDGAAEPHTFTIVDFGPDLPNTVEEVFNCEFCNQFFPQHFPAGEDGPPVDVLNAGPAGLDEVGDSVLVFPGETRQLPVSAPAGTNLFFLCIFHPWMQGRLNVR